MKSISRRSALAAMGVTAAGLSLGNAPPGRLVLTLTGRSVLISQAERAMSPWALRRVSIRREMRNPFAPEPLNGYTVHAHLRDASGRVWFSRDLGRVSGSRIDDLENAILEADTPGRTSPTGDPDDLPDGFDVPDERGEVWGGIRHQGRTVQCPIPGKLRKRNEGGSDGAGLCVVASQVCDGNWQAMVSEMANFWRAAKSRPGGYWPGRLKKLVGELHPEIKYLSYEGREIDWMQIWLGYGVPVGVTYGTGRGYQYQKISHMVSLVGLWTDYAAVIDNNFPRWVAWMPRAEFDRRFVMTGGYGWGFLWRKLMRDGGAPETEGAAFAILAAAGLGIGGLGMLGAAGLGALAIGRQLAATEEIDG